MLDTGSSTVYSKEEMQVKLFPVSMLNKLFRFSIPNIGSANVCSKQTNAGQTRSVVNAQHWQCKCIQQTEIAVKLFPFSLIDTDSATVSSQEKLQVKFCPLSMLYAGSVNVSAGICSCLRYAATSVASKVLRASLSCISRFRILLACRLS